MLGNELNIPVFTIEDEKDPRVIARQGVAYAKKNGCDLVIIDTAGRLQIDETLMQELVDIRDLVQPTEILLVVDGMTGQESVNVANEFKNQLDITGVILTKMDGGYPWGCSFIHCLHHRQSHQVYGCG